LIIVSVDNLKARHLAREATIKTGISTIFIGVTEDFGYFDWDDKVYLPSLVEEEEINKVLTEVRDVCTRIEFRPFGSLFSILSFYRNF